MLLRPVCVLSLALLCVAASLGQRSNHTNNWAVLVGTSRFWFNYRHIANTLSVYRSVQRLGIPDSNIILMLADDMACSPLNAVPGAVFNDAGREPNVYGESVEVDYRGYEVTPEAVIRVLTGRQELSTPRSKRLLTDRTSNVLVYLSGHGGDEFIKFQDSSVLSSQDLADAIHSAFEEGRFAELLLLVDSCQASTLAARLYTPGVIGVGSSMRGQPSWSHNADAELGVALIDSFTYYSLRYLEGLQATSRATLADLKRALPPRLLRSDPGWRTDLASRPLESMLLTDFFGAVRRAAVLAHEYPFDVEGL